MASFNRVIMIGNLTRDPDYKQLSSGQAVCRLSIASNRQFKNKQTGSMVQEVCYIDVDVWGAQAESCRQYLQKGRPVLIEGRLKFDTWSDAQGQNKNKHTIVADRVVFMSSGSNAELGGSEQQGDSSSASSGRKSTVSDELEKELLSQIENIKERSKAKAEDAKPAKKAKASSAAAKKEDTGDLSFNDTAPFDDELPF